MNYQQTYLQGFSYFVGKGLELMNQKCADAMARPGVKEYMLTAEFLRDFRTLTVGLGRQAQTIGLTCTFPRDGLMVVIGVGEVNRHSEDSLYTNLHQLSNREITPLVAWNYKSTAPLDKVRTLVLFHQQAGIKLDEFFTWAASLPHDETIEIIIFEI